MAANEVVDLDSESSDDEYKNPPRKPIGWNYQGTAMKTPKDELVTKVNGTMRTPVKTDESSDIEIVEVSPISGKPREFTGRPKIPSYSRAEIRRFLHNKTQSNINSFFSKEIRTETAGERRFKPQTINERIKKETDCEGKTEKRKRLPLVSLCGSEGNNGKSLDPEKTKVVERKSSESKKGEEKKIIENKIIEEKDKVEEEKKNIEIIEEVKSTEKKKVPVEENVIEKKNVEEKKIIISEEEKRTTGGGNDDEDSETSIAVLENFTGRWEEIKYSHDDRKIRDKLWKYYYLAHSSYTHSRKFIKLVEGSTRKLSVDNIYVVVKELLDNLKCYKDRPYKDKNNAATSTTAEPLPEETEEDVKRNKKLRKVEKKMKEISSRIKALEEQDIDLDDEDNSSYLIEDRLKRQFSRLHDYYCKIAECTTATGRPVERKFRYNGSRYEEVNKRITVYVNKTKEFPDYVDILNLLKKVTKDSLLPLRPETVRVQAQEIFREVGRMLKERRESDDLYNIYSYVDDLAKDPAAEDEELDRKLAANEVIAKDKLDKIFQEYVEKEADAREAADRNVKRSSPKKEASKEEEGETSTNKEPEVKNEAESEEEDEGEDFEMETFDDAAEGETEDDDEEEDEDEDEEVDDRQVIEYPNSKEEEDIEDTDDELRDVIASASVEEELSEEDVPIVDSEEAKYYEDADAESSSSIVCLDDTSCESTGILEKTTADPAVPYTKEAYFPSHLTDSSPKKRPIGEEYSPQKRPCLEILNP